VGNIVPKTFLPIEVAFHPSWWNKQSGIEFDEAFFFDPLKRVERERQMRIASRDRSGTSCGRVFAVGSAGKRHPGRTHTRRERARDL
jgi:hypothetical protein